MIITKEYIAKIIKNGRKKKGLKQAQFAEKIGISEKHLSKIETGKNYPSLDNFLKIMSLLNLSFSDFGLIEKSNESSKAKSYLQEIIHTSDEKHLAVYADIIETVRKHI